MEANKLDAVFSAAQAFKRLESSAQGLTGQEAIKRHARFGFNEITQKPPRPVILEAIIRALNPLVAILLIAASISYFTGGGVSAIIIMMMVVASVTLDYFQSHRSLAAAKALKNHVALTATVLRDGHWLELRTRYLVPGDIVHLMAGDAVPADVLLLTAKNLHVQQAGLTGESLPVEKDINPSSAKNPIDMSNRVFLGSTVVSGVGTAIVLKIGGQTLFGKIAHELNVKPPKTEFDKGILHFSLLIAKTIFVLVLFVFFVNAYLKHDLLESFLFAIALAVGLTPEFLPMMTTVILANAAVKMSHQKAIVKNLKSLQNLGSITILCSDKTGTLTTGQMVLQSSVDALGQDSEQVFTLAYLNTVFETGIKNPFNQALLEAGKDKTVDQLVAGYQKLDEIPFDFERRRATVVIKSVVVKKDQQAHLIVKGAPEFIFKVCSDYPGADFAQCQKTFHDLSAQGYRVLALAQRKIPLQSKYIIEDEKTLSFLGFLAFIDPLLPDAAKTIEELRDLGVSLKVLTGDSEIVANFICQQAGLEVGEIIKGEQVEALDDTALATLAEKTLVFARVSPVQKKRILTALQSLGHSVGYMGDGINDAPSLHIAEVGISVAGAVDIARDAADIILLEKHLNVLIKGVLEGRKAFANVMKYLMMGTSSNFGNMFSMAIATVFLPFLPMTALQILLNNLLYDFSQIMIPTDHVDEAFLHKPKTWDISIIRSFMLYIGPVSSLFDFLTFYVMLKFFHASEALFQSGWFVESLASQVLVVFIIRTVGSPLRSRPSWPLTVSCISVVILGLFLPFSPLAALLGFVPLPLPYFLFLFAATVIYLLLVQVIKQRLMYKWLGA